MPIFPGLQAPQPVPLRVSSPFMSFPHILYSILPSAPLSSLHEPERLCLDGEKEFGSEDDAGGIERDVETGDTCVGRGKMVVVGRSHRDTRHGLEAFLAGGKRRARHPEVHLHTEVAVRP